MSDKDISMQKALDMVFVVAQKSYEGYDYYDFFEQVYERLKGAPFYSNLSSEKEVRIFSGKNICDPYSFHQFLNSCNILHLMF